MMTNLEDELKSKMEENSFSKDKCDELEKISLDQSR